MSSTTKAWLATILALLSIAGLILTCIYLHTFILIISITCGVVGFGILVFIFIRSFIYEPFHNFFEAREYRRNNPPDPFS